MVATNSTVFAGGDFQSVGTKDRGYLASFDADTGGLRDWAPRAAGGKVWAIALNADATKLAVGGQFTTLNGSANPGYGLGMVAGSTGVLLNNELDDFTAAVGAANAYGLVGYEANLPGPNKRPLSSMSPTIVLKDGKPVLVTGSPGGSRIITAVLQIILNVIDHEMNVAEAVAAPRPGLVRASG